MAVDQDFLRTLKDKLNIVDIASNYFNLEKKAEAIGRVARSTTKKRHRFQLTKADSSTTVSVAAHQAMS
jgi:hypothetical protein